MLGVIYDPKAICEHEFNLRFDDGMQAACAGKIDNNRTVVMRGDRLAVVEFGAREVYVQSDDPEVGGDYPRIGKVVPRALTLQPGLIGTYGAPLLGRVKKAARAAAKSHEQGDRYVGRQFFNVSGDVNDRAVVRMEIEPNFVGVLMPMTIDAMASVP